MLSFLFSYYIWEFSIVSEGDVFFSLKNSWISVSARSQWNSVIWSVSIVLFTIKTRDEYSRSSKLYEHLPLRKNLAIFLIYRGEGNVQTGILSRNVRLFGTI